MPRDGGRNVDDDDDDDDDYNDENHDYDENGVCPQQRMLMIKRRKSRKIIFWIKFLQKSNFPIKFGTLLMLLLFWGECGVRATNLT